MFPYAGQQRSIARCQHCCANKVDFDAYFPHWPYSVSDTSVNTHLVGHRNTGLTLTSPNPIHFDSTCGKLENTPFQETQKFVNYVIKVFMINFHQLLADTSFPIVNFNRNIIRQIDKILPAKHVGSHV